MKEREGPLIGLGNGHVTNELIVFSCDQQLLQILSVLTDSINQTFGKTVSFCTISDALPAMYRPSDEAGARRRQLSLHSKQTGQDCLETNRERSPGSILLHSEILLQSRGVHRAPPILQQTPQVGQ